MLNPDRAGKISSSEAYKIHESDAVQKTYIEEIRMFNLFQQKDVEKDVFNFKWGHLLENYLHDKTAHLEGYVNQNFEEEPTIFSKVNPYHCGTPDQYTLENESTVCSETKCPVTIKGLYNLIFPFYTSGLYQEVDGNIAIQMIRKNSKDGKKYFDQILSNALLLEEQTGLSCDFGELIAFMPYATDISKITAYSQEFFTTEYYPIFFGSAETLPCIKPLKKEKEDFFDLEDKFPVNDFHRIRFDITQEMKDSFRRDLKAFTDRAYPQLVTA